jgi:transposase InsO family protein
VERALRVRRAGNGQWAAREDADVVDDCSKEVVAQTAVDTSIPALYVTRVLDQVKAKRGLPRVIRTDNGGVPGRTTQT